MQKTFLFLLLITAASVSFAQQAKPGTEVKKDDKTTQASNPNAPTVDFKEESYNFGDVGEGPQITHEFKFTNNGKEPLILANVKASCGCTTPSWPKDPILPGKEATILVTYNTQGRPGAFTKSITITSNATTPSKVIFIKGTVEKVDPAKYEPLEQPSMLTPKGTN
jgi:hypothetical protein